MCQQHICKLSDKEAAITMIPVSVPVELQCRAAENYPRTIQIRAHLTDADLWEGCGCSRALAFACAALCFSTDQKELLCENLKALGFGSLSLCGADNTDPARIGVTFAEKRMNGYTLVAAVLRGTHGAEWYSNFRIGFREEHRGFSLAADDAEEKLEDYLRGYAGCGEVRFLLTGYSRGGAVANLLARRLIDRCGIDGVRCYTFASPNTALIRSGANYSSVYNIVREEDFFTRVPLTGWGYSRYGRDIMLGGDIRDTFREISGEEYIGFNDKQPVDAVLGAVKALAPNVPAYYRRRYPVGDDRLSLYDYMLSLASMLSCQEDEDAGGLMLDSAASEFADLSAFLSSGMDISALLSPAAGIPRCSVADSHSPAAYLAAMQVSTALCGDAADAACRCL